MKVLYSLLVGLLIVATLISQETFKRGTQRISRGAFSRTTTPSSTFLSRTPSLKNQAQVRSSSLMNCPTLPKTRTQSFATESLKPSRSSQLAEQPAQGQFKRSGSRVLDFARRHPGKLVGVVSGIGTAAATYTTYKKYPNEAKIKDKIQQLSYALGHYAPLDPETQNETENKRYVDKLLKEFIEEGIVNKRDNFGNTPVMIILKSHYVKDDEKVRMLQMLFEHGAKIKDKDQKRALYYALGIFDINNTLQLNKTLRFDPKLKTLALIAPFIDQEKDIADLAKIYSDKVHNLQAELQSQEEKFQKLQKEKNPITGFFFDSQKKLQETVTKNLIKSYKERLSIDQKVSEIAQENLHRLQRNKEKKTTNIESWKNPFSQKEKALEQINKFLSTKEENAGTY